MRHGTGFPLSLIGGEWSVSGQPRGWEDTDPVLYGVYNRHIELSANVLPGTKVYIRMLAGSRLLLEGIMTANLPFESYPAVHVDHNGQESPSQIDQNLIGKEYLHFQIPVREREFYRDLPPVTLLITFTFSSQTVIRQYILNLIADPFSSGKVNVYQENDLGLLGVPFVPEHAGWLGSQPITGEYQYRSSNPVAIMDFTGFTSITCFAEGLEAQLDFDAFQKDDSLTRLPDLHTTDAIMLTLDLCRAGLDGLVAGIESISSQFVPVQIGAQTCFVLNFAAGTLIISEYYQPTVVLYTRSTVRPTELPDLLAGKRFEQYAEYDLDPYGFRRSLVAGISFWRVLVIKHPVPAAGGTYNGPFPTAFVNGVLKYIGSHPDFYQKLGALPSDR